MGDTGQQRTATSVWEPGVIEENRRWLLAYFLAALGDYQRSQDLVQETFSIAYRRQEVFDPARSHGAWLRGIARNLLMKEWKSRKRHALLISPEHLDAFEGPAEDLEELYADREYEEKRLAALRACFSKLREQAQEVLRLYYTQKTRIREIAARISLSATNVGVILTRSRKALGTCIHRTLSLDPTVEAYEE